MEISDNGKGDPTGELTALVRTFYSGRPGGLGLGLTTARTILHSHGVQLDVHRLLGQGTTFTLRFPERIFVSGT